MSNAIISWIDKELAEAEGISMELLTMLLPMLKSTAATVLTQVLPIAETAVESLASGTQPGAAKQASAVSQIGAVLETQGIAAAGSIVNTAIEIGLQNLNANTAAASTSATPPAPAAGAAHS